jgi:hypothetical protein
VSLCGPGRTLEKIRIAPASSPVIGNNNGVDFTEEIPGHKDYLLRNVANVAKRPF